MDAAVRRQTWTYTATSALPIAALAAVLALLLPVGGSVAVAGLIAVPWLGWRYDNATGTYFVLSLLALIILAVPALLLTLMAIIH